MIRRFGSTPDPTRQYRPRPGAYALLPRNGYLLLTLEMGPEPEFQLPGGGIDPGESPLAALHREVLEETGWAIAWPRRIGAFRRFVFMPEYNLWAEKLCTIYLAAPVIQRADPSEAHHAAIWMSPADAAGHLGNAGDRAFAHQLARGCF